MSLNRKEAPAIINTSQLNLTLPPYDFYELQNGIPVYAVNAGAQEVLELEICFEAGTINEAKTGIASATNFLIKNGTTTKSAFDISALFDYYGAYFNRSCYADVATLSLHTLSKYFKDVMPVFTDMLSNSIYDGEELRIYKQNSISALEVNLQKSDFVAGRKVNELLYGQQHPYGRFSSIDDISNLTQPELVRFYEQFYKNGNCAIFISGNLPTDFLDMLNKSIGNLPLKKAAFNIPELPTQTSSEQHERIELDPKAVQGAVRVFKPFINRRHPDYFNASIMNTIFGGYFGSRLMSNIREDKGYTYGISSYIQSHMHQSGLIITTDAGKKVSDDTITQVYYEMNRLIETAVGSDELELVKNYLMGSLLGNIDGPFQIMARWKSIIINNLDKNYFSNYVNAIKGIEPQTVQQMAKKYLQPTSFFDMIVY